MIGRHGEYRRFNMVTATGVSLTPRAVSAPTNRRATSAWLCARSRCWTLASFTCPCLIQGRNEIPAPTSLSARPRSDCSVLLNRRRSKPVQREAIQAKLYVPNGKISAGYIDFPAGISLIRACLNFSRLVGVCTTRAVHRSRLRKDRFALPMVRY